MSKWIPPLGLALLIMGCATHQPAAQTPAATTSSGQSHMEVLRGTKPEDQKLICSRSYPMDSHIPEQICVTPEQAAARKKAAQEQMQNMQNGPSPPSD